MTRALTLRSDASIKIALAAALLAVSLVFVPAPARAASLTSAQVNGVLGLLSAFNVPQSTIDTVRSILGGGTASTPATQTQTPATTQTQGQPATTGTSGEGTHTTTTTTGSGSSTSCKLSASQLADAKRAVALYDQADIAYNNLAKAIAFAGHAPAGYISPNVSPTIAQGPGVTDSIGGVTLPRADLYFAHDEAAKARTAAQCAALATCTTTYALPSTHASAQSALNAYYNAVFALPKFSGPAGMMTGGTQRVMNYIDYNTLKAQIAGGSCSAGGSSSSSEDESDAAHASTSHGDVYETTETPGSGTVATGSTGTTPVQSTPSGKPDAAHFVAAAHTDVSTASSMLYGVIGSNTDMRDWNVIMTSPDPLATARALTAAMYNSGSKAYLAAGATRPQDRKDTTVLAHAGNFTFYKEIIPGVGVNYVLALVDANGYQLTSAANPDVLKRLITNFGFNKSDLAAMQAQLDAAGFNLGATTSWPRNFMSGVSVAPIDAAAGLAAVGSVSLEATVNSINLLADQIMEINWSLANVLSAYVALFVPQTTQVAAAATAVPAPAPVAPVSGSESALMTLSFLPESFLETMTGVTDMMSAVEMAPVYVISDSLSNVLYQTGLY